MIRIDRYQFGFVPLSMIIVFIVLSVFAILSTVGQARPEWPMPLSSNIVINESIALLATLVYGILLHLIIALIGWHKSRRL